MYWRTAVLLYILGILTVSALVAGGGIFVGIDPNLSLLLGFCSCMLTVKLTLRVWSRWSSHAEERDLDKVRKPVLDALSRGPSMVGVKAVDQRRRGEKPEATYQAELIKHLMSTLATLPVKEQVLPSGTKVDIVMDHAGATWFITLKRGLNNQQRLVIQGEVEDILMYATDEREHWILIVVGMDVDPASAGWGQLLRLQEYAVLRSQRDGRRRHHDVHIEVVPVQMSDLSAETAQ